jgi:hypothetical protein
MKTERHKTPSDSTQGSAFDGLFVVDLKSLELSKEHSEIIEAGIQAAVLAALGALDLAPASRGGDRIGGGGMMGFRGDF